MREIYKVYAANFLQGLATVASVTFTLYFLSHGLSQYQISALFSVFMISLALFEIPTGGFADTFGHKASVALGLMLHSLSFLSFALLTTFPGFLFGMIVGALGLAFQSGAYSSLVHDMLQKLEKPQDFEKVMGRGLAFFEVAAILASFLGPFFYKIYPNSTQVIAFIVILLSSAVIYSIRWEFTKTSHVKLRYVTNIKNGIKLTMMNTRLLAIVVVGIALTVSRMLMNQNISQPYQLAIGVNVEFIGVAASIVAAMTALVYAYAHKVSGRIGPLYSLLLIILIPSISCFILGINTSLFIGVFFLIFFYSGHAYRDPALMKITNDQVNSEQRSTMVSTVSFLTSIVVGLLLPIWGTIIDVSGIRSTLFYLGFYTLTIGLIGILIFKTSKTHIVEGKPS